MLIPKNRIHSFLQGGRKEEELFPGRNWDDRARIKRGWRKGIAEMKARIFGAGKIDVGVQTTVGYVRQDTHTGWIRGNELWTILGTGFTLHMNAEV